MPTPKPIHSQELNNRSAHRTHRCRISWGQAPAVWWTADGSPSFQRIAEYEAVQLGWWRIAPPPAWQWDRGSWCSSGCRWKPPKRWRYPGHMAHIKPGENTFNNREEGSQMGKKQKENQDKKGLQVALSSFCSCSVNIYFPTSWDKVLPITLTAQWKAETQQHLQCRIQAEQQSFWESQRSVAVWCCVRTNNSHPSVFLCYLVWSWKGHSGINWLRLAGRDVDSNVLLLCTLFLCQYNERLKGTPSPQEGVWFGITMC